MVCGGVLQAEAGEVRRMLEEASAQVAQQAEALEKAGSESEGKAAELASAQKQLSSAIASLDSANANLAEQTELISSLKVENTGRNCQAARVLFDEEEGGRGRHGVRSLVC